MQYDPPIDLNDENTMPHVGMIQLTGVGKKHVGCRLCAGQYWRYID